MQALIKTTLEKRGSDKWGSGEFGASRGGRTHNGIDYRCPPGAQILCPVDGVVTKLGYPYGNDLSFRYVEVTDFEKRKHRIFYVTPVVLEGWHVAKDDVIGTAQDLEGRYSGITPHVHYEILHDGAYLNPETI